MVYVRRLRKNEGLHIETDKGPIDVIVMSIGGPPKQREGWIQIRGILNINLLYLKHWHAPKRLNDDIEISIDCSGRVDNQKIPIYCNTEYPITKKEYD